MKLFEQYKATADSLVLAKDWHGVIEYHTKALEIKPDDHTCLLVRGGAYHAIGDHKKAYKDYDRLAEISKNSGAAYYDRAMVSFNLVNEGVTDEEYTRHTPCEDLLKAKELGYPAEYDIFKVVCPDL